MRINKLPKTTPLITISVEALTDDEAQDELIYKGPKHPTDKRNPNNKK